MSVSSQEGESTRYPEQLGRDEQESSLPAMLATSTKAMQGHRANSCSVPLDPQGPQGASVEKF